MSKAKENAANRAGIATYGEAVDSSFHRQTPRLIVGDQSGDMNVKISAQFEILFTDIIE